MGGFFILFRHSMGLLWKSDQIIPSQRPQPTQANKTQKDTDKPESLKQNSNQNLGVQAIKTYALKHAATGTGNSSSHPQIEI
jgi:hypothetical protein